MTASSSNLAIVRKLDAYASGCRLPEPGAVQLVCSSKAKMASFGLAVGPRQCQRIGRIFEYHSVTIQANFRRVSISG